MKNINFGIISLVAVIGFLMTGCDSGTGGDGNNNSANYSCQLSTGACIPTVSVSDCSQAGGFVVDVCQGQPISSSSSSDTPSGGASSSSQNAQISSSSDNGDNNVNTNPDIGTGDVANRKYKVEVYSITSASYDYGKTKYGKSYQDVVKADLISKTGSTLISSNTNQTFSDVSSILSTAATSIGYTSSTTGMTNSLTEALQTNNRSGWFQGFYSGSNYRFFYVNRTGTNPNYYTVEVYNISSATYTYGNTTYGGKAIWDIVRADFISREGTTLINSYTNQTFSDVSSKLNSAAANIGYITDMTNNLTEVLQTQNYSGWYNGFFRGSTYRFFFVKQE